MLQIAAGIAGDDIADTDFNGGITMGQKMEDAKGRLKEAAGDIRDDAELKRKGKIDRAAAKVKKNADDAVEKVKDAADKALDRINEKTGTRRS